MGLRVKARPARAADGRPEVPRERVLPIHRPEAREIVLNGEGFMSMRAIASVWLALVLAAATGLVSQAWAADPPAAKKAAVVPCDKTADAIRQQAPAARLALAQDAIKQKCQPLSPPIVSAITKSAWEDGSPLAMKDRLDLTIRATSAGYPEAETLTVVALEMGRWPDGKEIEFGDGAQLVQSLKPVLTPYRTHLLLDIYEQITVPSVRLAVVLALRGSKLNEALLPAIDACYKETGPTHEAGMTAAAAEPEKSPDPILARLLKSLPEGPFLNWAMTLAKDNSSPVVASAKKDRGL